MIAGGFSWSPDVPVAGSPPATALAALSAEPGGATVAVIAGRSGLGVATARLALIAHEKAGAATRVKGPSRPNIPDRRKPTGAPAALPDQAAKGRRGD